MRPGTSHFPDCPFDGGLQYYDGYYSRTSEATRITDKGQTTIPKELREKYDLDPGDEVIWIDTDDGIVVKKRTRTAGRGLLVPDDTSDEKREAVAAELGRRIRERRERNYEEN